MNAGVFTVDLLAGVFVILVIVFLSAYLQARAKRERYARAVPAKANIIDVGRSYTSGMWGGQDIDFTIEVMPPSGASYREKVTWSVEPLSLPKIKAGHELAIRIDRRDPHKIYSAEQWAWSWSQIPLRYGDKVVIGFRVR